MASLAFTDSAASASPGSSRFYSVCSFDRGLVVPRVTLLEAYSDDEAIRAVSAMSRFFERELWDRHRLVAVIRATGHE